MQNIKKIIINGVIVTIIGTKDDRLPEVKGPDKNGVYEIQFNDTDAYECLVIEPKWKHTSDTFKFKVTYANNN